MKNVGLAVTLAGTLLGAVGGLFGYSMKRDPVYKQIDDKNRPQFSYVESTKIISQNENYTFRYGDTLWRTTSEKYKSINLAKKVNEIADHNAPKHTHHDNHLQKDTKVVVKNKVINAKDGIRGDVIRAGDTLEFPAVEKTVKSTERVLVGYEKKSEMINLGYPSKAGYGALLGILFGSFVGFGIYSFFKTNDANQQKKQKPEKADKQAISRFFRTDIKANGKKKSTEKIIDLQEHVKISTDYVKRNQRRYVVQDYVLEKRSIDVIAKTYNLDTTEIYRILSGAKISQNGSGITFRWDVQLASETNELIPIKNIISYGRETGKSLPEIAQMVKDKMGFEMSEGDIANL